MDGLKRLGAAAARLYRCERGAEGLEKLLIIGAIVLPILGALIIFRDAIAEWVGGLWDDVSSADPPVITDP